MFFGSENHPQLGITVVPTYNCGSYKLVNDEIRNRKNNNKNRKQGRKESRKKNERGKEGGQEGRRERKDANVF